MAKGYFRGEGHHPRKKKIHRCSYCGQYVSDEDFLEHIKKH